MKSLSIIVLLSMMGCAHTSAPASNPKAHNAMDHNENLRWSIDSSLQKQEKVDRLDQLMYLKN